MGYERGMEMKRVLAATFAVAVVLLGVFAAMAQAEALTEEQRDKFYEKNINFHKVYDFYSEDAEMNAFNLLDQKESEALFKATDTAIAERAKELMEKGQEDAEAYAIAYAEQILVLERAVILKLTKGGGPREGFYELQSDALRGYMSIRAEGERFILDFAVWEIDNPGTYGKGNGNAERLNDETTVVSLNDSGDEVETITVVFSGESAEVKAAEAFKNGGFLTGALIDPDTEKYEKSTLSIDGKYIKK
jgi:hypothetical protein